MSIVNLEVQHRDWDGRNSDLYGRVTSYAGNGDLKW